MEQGSHGPDGGSDGAPRRYSYTVKPRAGTVGEALRHDRLRLNLDQVEVASELGFHQTKLSAYELGKIKHPPPERLVKLARKYQRPDDYYLKIVGYPEAAALVRELERLESALVVPEPRPGLADLVEVVADLHEERFQHVVTVARDELTWQQERAAQAAPARGATRDTA